MKLALIRTTLSRNSKDAEIQMKTAISMIKNSNAEGWLYWRVIKTGNGKIPIKSYSVVAPMDDYTFAIYEDLGFEIRWFFLETMNKSKAKQMSYKRIKL